jgi:PAS domain S-box-containing protein
MGALAAFVGLAVALGALVLWMAMTRNEDARIDLILEEQTLHLAADVRVGLARRQASISRVGRRLGGKLEGDRSAFELEAAALLDDFPYLDVLVWMQPDGGRWVITRPGSASLRDPGETPRLGEAVEAARETGAEQFCDCIRQWDGREGLAMVVPVERDDGMHFLLAVFRMPEVFESLVNPGLLDRRVVVLSENGGVRFNNAADPGRTRLPEAANLDIEGLAWWVQAGLADPRGRELRTALPEVALASGILLGGLLAMALGFFGLSRRRAAAAEKARSALESEVEERRRIEAALRESEERFRSVFDKAAVGIAIVDRRGFIVAANPAIGAMLGYEPDEIVGRHFSEFSHPEDAARDQVVLQEILLGQRSEFVNEERFVHRSGRPSWGRISVTPMRDAHGEIPSVIGLIEDVNERRRAQRALEDSAERLTRSNEDLDRFASVVAHDLREPLLTIRLYAEELRHAIENGGAEAAELAGRMADATLQMDALIQALLTHARVTTGRAAFETVRLDEVVEAVVDHLRGRLDALGGRIDVGRLPVVEADASQMRQLFQNLLFNALKFRRPSEPPRIRVEAEPLDEAPRENGRAWVLIRVVDNGIGIEPDHAEAIFEEFTRLRAPDYEGTGMGLAICRRIVERHGGRIRARANTGPGMTVEIRMPVQAPRPEASMPEGRDGAEAAGP